MRAGRGGFPSSVSCGWRRHAKKANTGRSHRGGVSAMAEPKNSDVRTIALRVSPDYHAQLALVAQVDEITLTDLMQRALDAYIAERRAAPDFQAKAQAALADAEAQM